MARIKVSAQPGRTCPAPKRQTPGTFLSVPRIEPFFFGLLIRKENHSIFKRHAWCNPNRNHRNPSEVQPWLCVAYFIRRRDGRSPVRLGLGGHRRGETFFSTVLPTDERGANRLGEQLRADWLSVW